jgi:O-antigen biosynthesis protein
LYKQLTALFARYVAAHLKALGNPQAIHAPNGDLIGAIDAFTLSDGQIRLAGWTTADEVVLHMNGIKAATKPVLRRDDVARIHGLDPHTGFDLTYPLGPVNLTEITRFGVEFHRTTVCEPPVAVSLTLQKLRWAQLGLVLRFWLATFAQSAAIMGWLVTRDAKYRARIKQGLHLTLLPAPRQLDPDLFRPGPGPVQVRGAVTIVMPVYNAFDLLQDCLARVKAHTDLPWRLVLIEDCSTDTRVRPFLQAWQAAHPDQVMLLQNQRNLGFIQSVNRGFAKAILWGDPVILLNTDALVPAGWASRLIYPMQTNKNVATVTPMSNDAEIFTAPLICTKQDLEAGQADKIDRVAATLNPTAERALAPTGVGFCMAINMRYLAKRPVFDTIFGRGYGEEVDWCQRARAMGGIHLCANTLFVEHRGGQSFGAAEKQRLIAANNQQISKRYPHYDTAVQRFVQSDPLRSTRLALALAWVGSQDIYPVSIYLAHSMGGGADAYLRDRIATRHHRLGRSAIVLRVGGKLRWQLELVTPDGTIAGQTDDFAYILKLLAPVTRRRIIYSCGVGDHDPAGLPDAILQLCADGQHALEMLFHDYFAISPSYTLLDQDGVFSGIPNPKTGGPCLGDHKANNIPLDAWQGRWGQLVTAAKEIIVFSHNSAALVRKAYPEAGRKMVVRPHRLGSDVPVLKQPTPGARRVLGILGDIGLQKGAKLIFPLGTLLEGRDIGCVIVGNFDASFPKPASVPVHGTYRVEDIPKIAARYGITEWLIPSVWPETFSFTTHEALATGLPVHAFALGAQGDAVEQAPNGISIPFEPGLDPAPLMIDHFDRHFDPRRQAA